MTQKEAEPLDIVLYPNPFLTKKCRSVSDEEIKAGAISLTDKEHVPGVKGDWKLQELAERMMATMYKANGIGLAAPQIGVGIRLWVADISKDKSGQIAILNPLLSKRKGSVVEEEGCLSIPNVRAKVKRDAELKVTGVNLKGEPVEAEVDELFARVCQHETDHLDGVLFINKLGMTSKLMIRKQLVELEEDYKNGGAKK
jgi:peptide deformylase